MAIEKAIFRRAELLLGKDAVDHIGQQRVIIFGVGGVGSWCAEGLIRSGIRLYVSRTRAAGCYRCIKKLPPSIGFRRIFCTFAMLK